MTQKENVPSQSINMRLSVSMLGALKVLAAKRGIPYKTLIVQILEERLLEVKKAT